MVMAVSREPFVCMCALVQRSFVLGDGNARLLGPLLSTSRLMCSVFPCIWAIGKRSGDYLLGRMDRLESVWLRVGVSVSEWNCESVSIVALRRSIQLASMVAISNRALS
jgi:hypothetical protein